MSVSNDTNKKSLKGGIIVLGGQIVSTAITLIKGILLARILLPEDFGIVSAVVAIASFGDLLIDGGISTVIIQSKKLTVKQISFIFYVNILVGLVVFLLSQLSVTLIAQFYENESIIPFARVYFVSFILSSIYPLHLAFFKRNLKFKLPTTITIFSQFVSLAVGFYLAFLDYGAWSLIWMMVANHVLIAILTLYYSELKLKFERSSFTSDNFNILLKGLNILGFNFVNYFSRNVDKILIAKYFSPHLLGVYSKAYELSTLPINKIRGPIESVVLPALSRLQDDKQAYKNYYKIYLKGLLFIIWIVILPGIIYSEELILFLLGENWLEMNDIFRLLLLNALVQPIAGTRGVIMLSNELNKRYFAWGTVNAVFTVISFFIGINFSFLGLAIAYTSYNIAIVVPSLIYAFKGTAIKWTHFFAYIYRIAIFLLITSYITYLIKGTNIQGSFVLSILTFVIGVCIVLYLEKDISKILNKYAKKYLIK